MPSTVPPLPPFGHPLLHRMEERDGERRRQATRYRSSLGNGIRMIACVKRPSGDGTLLKNGHREHKQHRAQTVCFSEFLVFSVANLFSCFSNCTTTGHRQNLIHHGISGTRRTQKLSSSASFASLRFKRTAVNPSCEERLQHPRWAAFSAVEPRCFRLKRPP